MLVLTRKLGEKVVLSVGGVRFSFMPLEIRSGQVKFGFDAPPQVQINREEVQVKVDREIRQGGA